MDMTYRSYRERDKKFTIIFNPVRDWVGMASELSEGIGSAAEKTASPRGMEPGRKASLRRHLVLVGMMGCGKSVLGRWLARRSGLPLHDLDRMVARRERRSISALFREKGEDYFRQREGEALRRALDEPTGILSTGGGTFVFEENRRLLLTHGIVFYLEAPVDLLEARLRESRGRPLLAARTDRRRALQELLEERGPFYRMAHVTVAVDGRSREELGEWIWRTYSEWIGRNR